MTWVYDTTSGTIIEKGLYYRMEKPVITKVNEKQDILDYIEYKELLEQDFEHDKYALPIMMPAMENYAQISKRNDDLYAQELQDEIDAFKTKVGYNDICSEVKEDMQAKGINIR